MINFHEKEEFVNINCCKNVHIGILYIALAKSSSAVRENKSCEKAHEDKNQKINSLENKLIYST